ncbi:MAG: GNAT family N-acetyltransferase [Microlunatus sp.]
MDDSATSARSGASDATRKPYGQLMSPQRLTLRCQKGELPREIAELIGSWATPTEDALMWEHRVGGPVPADLVLARAADQGVIPFTLHADAAGDENPLAYGELWVDDDETEVEVARLIVDPRFRSRGIGARLARELGTRAQAHHPDVFLRVRPDNAAARRCYEKAGYRRVDPESEQQWNIGQPLPYAWYRYSPPDGDQADHFST